MDEKQDDIRIAVGNFSLQAQLPGGSGRSIQMAGYIYSDDDEATLNKRFDLYNSVLERQRTLAEIPELEAKREQMIKGMEQARDVLTELETKQQNGITLTSAEKMQIKNMSINIRKVMEEIDKGAKAIEEAKRKAA